MVRIYRDAKGAYMVQTNCLTSEDFVSELAEALAALPRDDDGGALAFLGAMTQAMPIAFKLAGYKADGVTEQRTLVCGTVIPGDQQVVASVGR